MADVQDIESLKTQMASREIVRVACQAQETFKEKGCRWDTYFYKVVLGGNIKSVKEVVAYMKKNDMETVLDWLWQKGHYEEMEHDLRMKSKKLLALKLATFIGLSVISILLTPLFYLLHFLSNVVLNQKQQRISANIRLPLAFAAFSQNKELMGYFLSQGVEVDNVDKYGNNVFHYIADLSAVAADNAISIFLSTVRFIDDTDAVKSLMVDRRNSAGLSAIEYVAKYGSPSLLSEILKKPNLLSHVQFAVGSDAISFDEAEESTIDASTRVEQIDVSKYESGSIMDKSALLNILSDRDVARMTAQELNIFSDVELIGKWVSLKTKQMWGGIIARQVIDIAVTCMLIFILVTTFVGTNGSAFYAWQDRENGVSQIDEARAWYENRSSILTLEAFHELVEDRQHLKLQQWFKRLQQQNPDKAELICDIAQKDLHSINSSNRCNISDHQMDALFDQIILLDEFKDHVPELMVYRNMSPVLQEFGKIFKPMRNVGHSRVYYNGVGKAAYDNITITYDNEEIAPSSVINYTEFLLNFMCVTNRELKPQDFQNLDGIGINRKFLDLTNDTCNVKMVTDLATERDKCRNIDKDTLAELLFKGDRQHFTVVGLSRLIAIIVAVLYIVLDTYERCMFVITCTARHTTFYDMIISVLGKKVPGSYARKQLSILCYMGILLHSILWYFHEDNDQWDEINKYDSWRVGEIVFIIAIIIRCMMHIHTMRLVPGIGHFVITTFMMATNLLHFSTIFAIVLFIFSALFYILIDNPECSIQSMEGFETLQQSVFSTFKLTFGHGDFAPFFSSTPVSLTYVLYVIIVGLLLLNLIIAIMSTTATEIMAEPWREVLWKVEWLDEATSVEYTFNVLSLPCRKLSLFGYVSHEKAGFIVKRVSKKKSSIYIELFQCPALK